MPVGLRTITIDTGIDLHRHHAFRILRVWPLGSTMLVLGRFMGGRTWYFLGADDDATLTRPHTRVAIRSGTIGLADVKAWTALTGIRIPGEAWAPHRAIQALRGEFPETMVLTPVTHGLAMWPVGSLPPLPRLMTLQFAQRLPRIRRLSFLALSSADVWDYMSVPPAADADPSFFWRVERLEFLMSRAPSAIYLAREELGYLVFEFRTRGLAVADTPGYRHAAYVAPLADWPHVFTLPRLALRKMDGIQCVPHVLFWERAMRKILP